MAEDSPEKPRRTPQHKLSEDEKAMIEAMLRRPDVKGNISITATLLGLNYGAVESYVRRTPRLAAMCPEKDAEKMVPGDTQLINRPRLPEDAIIISPAEFEQYQGFVRQNKKMLAKDWEALGMTAAQGEKMERYARIGSSPISQVIRSSYGQLIKNMGLLDEVIEADAQKILDGNLPAELNQDGSPKDKDEVARQWRSTLFKGMKLQLDMTTQMWRAQALMAQTMINAQKAMQERGKPQKGRLGASAALPATKTHEDAAT